MSATTVCLLTVILANAHLAEAGPTGLRGQLAQRPMTMTDVETTLTNELSSVSRGGAAREHIASLEAALAPMYTAVPKEADGTLGHAVVRYVLHRFFVQQRGWFIRGLEPGNTSSLQAASLASNHNLLTQLDWVPNYLQKFVEELHGGRGISLRELAVLAATFQDLIHKESVQRLEMTFTALELPFSAELDEEGLRQALQVYMRIYIRGGNFTLVGRDLVKKDQQILSKKPYWAARQQWVNSQFNSILLQVAPAGSQEQLNFGSATRAVEEVGKRFSTYNNEECDELKAELLSVESTKAGRVRLPEFYRKGLSGIFKFNEKIEFLRALGAVDESDPNEPYVIVPNYVSARPNCLKASNFYVVCCRNQCEDLQGALENKFEGSMAKPKQILEVVETLSTKTVEAPRKLPESLVNRLNSIAQANKGQVPLHGRLFAQWLHHAFPRECSFPQPAGAVSPITADEWMEANGHESASKTNEEMQVMVDSDGCILPKGEKAREHHGLAENELPWDSTEELLHVPQNRPQEELSHVPQNQAQDETLTAAVGKAPGSSLLATATPMAAIACFVASMGAFVWKMLPQSKQRSTWDDGMMC